MNKPPKTYTVRLHLSIGAYSRSEARAIATILCESLADAAENLDDPGQLLCSCVDNEKEIEEEN